jgi:hypothetical protein
MSSTSETTTDATSLRQALARLRARLDRQEKLLTEGFEALRSEIESLDAQCREFAQRQDAPSVPPEPEPVEADESETETAEEPAESTTVVQQEPTVVPTVEPESESADKAETTPTIEPGAAPTVEPALEPPLVTPIQGAADEGPKAHDAKSQFDFGQATPTDNTAANDFRFGSEPDAPAAAEPIHVSPTPVVAPTVGGQIDMEQVMFGQDLAANQSLYQDRNQLLQGLYTNDPAAMTLLGQLLIFRGATSERMPGLLKDIGEAYYRWRPQGSHGPDAFRDELTGWLQRKCEAAGVPNTIQLVRPGDRYDSKRHHSKQRGVEVSEVRGWVVLRDNGKVYTKATVDLK